MVRPLLVHEPAGGARGRASARASPSSRLRLLGRLDEELSCANSRFFRTALYANAAISDELRKNWILHWESVRPAPKVTIDFGDGRVLEPHDHGQQPALRPRRGRQGARRDPGTLGTGRFS